LPLHRVALERVPNHSGVRGSLGSDPSRCHSLYQRGGKILGVKLGLRQDAVYIRLADGYTEGGAEIGGGANLTREISSVFLVMDGKDTLALGKMTVAMIFQSTIPVTFGMRAVLAVI
jgi:hypothetical protein